MEEPYHLQAFGELVIPKDWVFYTALPGRLAKAGNEEALGDLLRIITRVRRSRGMRFHGLLDGRSLPNLAGVERDMKGTGK